MRVGDLSVRRVAASWALDVFPMAVREALLEDREFRAKYDIKVDSQLSFEEVGIAFVRSELFDAVRSILRNPITSIAVKDTSGQEWRLEVLDGAEGSTTLIREESRLLLPRLWPLLPDDAKRIESFKRTSQAVNLPKESSEIWCGMLQTDHIDDDVAHDVLSDLRDTPLSIEKSLRSQLNGRSSFSSLVPSSVRYFERLVGRYKDGEGLSSTVTGGVKENVDQLIAWNKRDGLSLALLLASHSSIVSLIDLDEVGLDSTLEVFDQLRSRGDTFSQLAAIELGLGKVHEWPALEPKLVDLIAEIRDSDPNDAEGRFARISKLIVLVDGQISQTRLFLDRPPFWRRLASIAHASLIERCISDAGTWRDELSDWVLKGRGEQFFLQCLCDLRLEPRWLPDFVNAEQLKSEFIGRIWNAAERNKSDLRSFPDIYELLFSEKESIRSVLNPPYPFFSGPLEGNIEPQSEMPGELNELLESNLRSSECEPKSFNALINSSLVYKISASHSEMAARALREARRNVRQGISGRSDFPLVTGLAVVAAVTRSTDMAEEVRMLTRKLRRQAGQEVEAEEVFQILLILAACHEDLDDWCDAVGDNMTELTFSDLDRESACRFLSHIRCLCRIVPDLWPRLSKAEAGLVAYVS